MEEFKELFIVSDLSDVVSNFKFTIKSFNSYNSGLVISGLNFEYNIFEKISFKDDRFNNVSFIGCIFEDCIFDFCYLDCCIFKDCIFTRCKFRYNYLYFCSFENCMVIEFLNFSCSYFFSTFIDAGNNNLISYKKCMTIQAENPLIVEE